MGVITAKVRAGGGFVEIVRTPDRAMSVLVSPGMSLSIEITRAGPQLHMTLTNPMPAENRHAPGNRMAIANIRERLQLHFDAEATMKSEVRDGIYTVTIRMPYLTGAAA